jgi:hypothetical protein
MTVTSDDSRFWRVYRTEWSVVYVSDSDGEAGKQECLKRFEESFRDSGHFMDWRVVAWSESDPDGWAYMLELQQPVLKGEYRDRPTALIHAREIGGKAIMEGSREDTKIRRKTG